MTDFIPTCYLVFAYNYDMDGSCTKARRASKYTNGRSAYFAALALRKYYDEVCVV
jgi:hypothetical protein